MEEYIEEIVMSYKPLTKIKRIKVSCSQDCYEYLKNKLKFKGYKEEFFVVYLNRANEIRAFSRLSVGGMSGTVADIRLIFREAFLSLSQNIILAHTHPSGNTYPSSSDERLTNKVKQGCTYLDLQLLDHIIIGIDTYYSFTDEGKI